MKFMDSCQICVYSIYIKKIYLNRIYIYIVMHIYIYIFIIWSILMLGATTSLH